MQLKIAVFCSSAIMAMVELIWSMLSLALWQSSSMSSGSLRINMGSTAAVVLRGREERCAVLASASWFHVVTGFLVLMVPKVGTLVDPVGGDMGEGCVSCVVLSACQGGQVCISSSLTGKGSNMKVLPRIFTHCR